LRGGAERYAEILIITDVGAYLAQHFPRQTRDLNELPDRLVVLR